MSNIHVKVYVTKKMRTPPISVVYGSTGVGIEMEIMDYDLPAGSTAEARATGKFAAEVYKNPCTVDGNIITMYPETGFFVPGGNEFQVVITAAGKNILSFVMDAICDKDIGDGNDPAKPEQVLPLVQRAENAAAQSEAAAARAEEVKGSIPEDYTELSDGVNQLKDDIANYLDVETDEIYKVESGDIDVDNNYQWLMTSKIFVSGQKLTKMVFKTKLANDTEVNVKVSLFDVDTKQMYSYKQFTVCAKDGYVAIQTNFTIERKSYISIQSDKTFSLCGSVSYGDLIGFPINATSYTSLYANEYGFNATFYSVSTKIDSMDILNKEIHVGDGLKYSEIQDVLDNITDDNIVIILHPKSTPYKRFSMMRKLNESYPWSGISTVRNISIIGIDKTKCIVQDDSGDYNTPPAEIACNGLIKNITFISTHNQSTDTQKDPSYAVHVDNRPKDSNGMKLYFEDCDFISEQTAGVGVGIYKNQTISFDRCKFYNNADLNYKPNSDYHDSSANIGAFFAHTSMGYENGNDNLIIKNCEFYSLNSNYSAKFQGTEENDTCVLTAINNTLWSHGANANGCYFIGYEIPRSPYNRGNNSDLLN